MIGDNTLSIKLVFIKINKLSNYFYLENIFVHYSFGVELKNDILLNDFYKINNNKFIFVSTIEYTKLYISIIVTLNNYSQINYNSHILNLETSSNNNKFVKGLTLGMYKEFLIFTYTISTNNQSKDFSSYLIFSDLLIALILSLIYHHIWQILKKMIQNMTLLHFY